MDVKNCTKNCWQMEPLLILADRSVKCLLACLLPSSLLRVRNHLVYQQSPSVLRQPWTLCHCSVWPGLDINCPSSPQPALSSLTNEYSFQYFGAQVSDSDHMAEILEWVLQLQPKWVVTLKYIFRQRAAPSTQRFRAEWKKGEKTQQASFNVKI